MEEQAVKAMEEARAGMVSSHPSLGYLSFKLNWFADSSVPTAWTDGISVGFNPEFVMSLTKPRRKFLAAHEVGHPMLGHHLRRGDRDPKKWNIACDHVVNLILVEQGFTLIKDALLDYRFKGMAVEEVYNILFPPDQEDASQEPAEDASDASNGQEDPEGQDGDKNGSEGVNDGSDEQKGEERNDSSSGGSDKQDPKQAEGPEDQGGGESKSGDEAGNSGKDPGQDDQESKPDDSASGSHDQQTGSESRSDPSDPGGCGEVRDFPGESADDVSMEEEKWSIAVQQAAQITRKLEGHVPGFVETILTDLYDPKLPWEEILSRWLTSKAKIDYSWNRPNPRYSSTGFVMPVLESHELGKVAIFWDTSCSVTDDQVAAIASETLNLLSIYPGVEVDLYHIDTEVRYIERLDAYTDWDNISARGRGGTDFRPGFEALEESTEEAPIGVIYMTDGECSLYPRETPTVPVLWVVVDMPHHVRFVPPFGEVTYYENY
jgi:predicted metal-dependent peptidase